jgi:cytochrome c oxidase subunit I+III
MIIAWMWDSDPKPVAPVDIGGGIKLPTHAAGTLSHSWWAMIVLLLVAGSLYLSYVFSYLYLWTVSPQVWPKPETLAPIAWPLASGAMLVVSSAVILTAGRVLPSGPRGSGASALLMGLAGLALAAALVIDVSTHWQAGVRPDADAHGAMVYMALFLQAQLTLSVLLMTGFAIARSFAGHLDNERRAIFDNLALLSHYTVGQSLLGLLLVHGFPRLAS